MSSLAQLDHRHLWHPFTQMRDWLSQEPIVITRGQGARLWDAQGRGYLDGNSSIWTNLHGHNHPRINAAIRSQLKKIAHSSALGLANEPASLLAERLVHSADSTLTKVFLSDDGSTAMEVALKLAFEYARRTGHSQKPRFLSLEGAYHGDTVGAASLGHLVLFQQGHSQLLFKTDKVMAPYCYRCPFNRATPERADAREYRKCQWECVGLVEKQFAAQAKGGNPYAAMVVEPLIQGAAGMIPQPPGWLRKVEEIVRRNGAQLIADEVMTGFGRTGLLPVEQGRSHENENGGGLSSSALPLSANIFACQREEVQPDFLVVAKGLTGGYLPMAATLTTQAVFDVFLGDYSEFKTFFHGHSFTGNQLGSSAALASLEVLQSQASIRARKKLEQTLRQELQTLWALPQVGDIRQVGLIVGVELVQDWHTRRTFPLSERAGIRVCEAMARRGVLTRPIGNVIVLMPPYCTTVSEAKQMITALHGAIGETFAE